MSTALLQFRNQQAPAFPDNPTGSADKWSLLRQAAQAGDADAAFQLSLLMMEAEKPDYAAITVWLEKAAEQRHPYATYNLLRLREAAGTSFERHLQQYSWLAEAGLLPAQLGLLEYYADRNDPQNVYWARQVAEQGHPFGQYLLAVHHHLCGEPDLERARELYHQAAAQGLHAAHWQLGQIYRHGIGTPPDNVRAALHLRQAAENGFIAAQTMLGDLMAGQNQCEALQWYRTAAANGDLAAQAALARHYLTGQLADRDTLQALRHAKTAAGKGHPEALRLLGDIYRYGLGVKADVHAAQQYYRQAAEAGDLQAYQKLLSDAALYHQTQYAYTKAVALMRQQTEDAYLRALACHQGRNCSIDYVLARKLYLEAAECHHAASACQLGLIYHYGQGVKADPRQAAYWFGIAAEQNEAAAQYHLARLYYYGQGVAMNIEMACHWLQAAIDNGYENPQAFSYLLEKWKAEHIRQPISPTN